MTFDASDATGAGASASVVLREAPPPTAPAVPEGDGAAVTGTATTVAAANKVTACRVVKAVSCGRAATRNGTE